MANEGILYKVKVNEFEYSLSALDVEKTDLIRISTVDFHLLQQHHSIKATLIATDLAAKKITLKIAGEKFVVEIKEELDQVLEKMGFNLAANKQLKEIKAPMPGLVLQVAVTVGQQVKQGDKILILSAMKMENSITISADATIKKINIKEGQAVDKGQVLVELE